MCALVRAIALGRFGAFPLELSSGSFLSLLEGGGFPGRSVGSAARCSSQHEPILSNKEPAKASQQLAPKFSKLVGSRLSSGCVGLAQQPGREPSCQYRLRDIHMLVC